jgi:hypothetical protein
MVLASEWGDGNRFASVLILFGLPLIYYGLNRHAYALNTKDTKGTKDF